MTTRLLCLLFGHPWMFTYSRAGYTRVWCRRCHTVPVWRSR